EYADPLIQQISKIESISPFRHLITPGGFEMSVAMTNCGEYGWFSDRKGYRYVKVDPLTGKPWPKMPELYLSLAGQIAAKAGFENYEPDVCLINRYSPSSRLSLHQDKDEKDPVAPIVSISLGLSATFMFGGLKRKDRPQRYLLEHGDAAVWGGKSRFVYHGISSVVDGDHFQLGAQRVSLTFRKVI
ncbi:MAG: DNA oxidative demethylase AlkB, partial [Gammaproteobacteria bacterium]|nr:DNA oxidative demethylase AlkB [Gammaproteobacteria bacterium]